MTSYIKNIKILLPSLNRDLRTEPRTPVPCDGGDKMLGTLPPYRSVLGASPANEALKIGSLLPSNSVTWGVPLLTRF